MRKLVESAEITFENPESKKDFTIDCFGVYFKRSDATRKI